MKIVEFLTTAFIILSANGGGKETREGFLYYKKRKISRINTFMIFSAVQFITMTKLVFDCFRVVFFFLPSLSFINLNYTSPPPLPPRLSTLRVQGSPPPGACSLCERHCISLLSLRCVCLSLCPLPGPIRPETEFRQSEARRFTCSNGIAGHHAVQPMGWLGFGVGGISGL